MENKENYELLFLVVKFLRESTCQDAADLLEKELSNTKRSLLPPRLDWEGRPHHQTYSDLERQFPRVGPGHLASLAAWLAKIPRTESVSGPRSLLVPPGSRLPRPRLSSLQQVVASRQLGLTRRGLNSTTPKSSLSVYTSVYQRLALQRRTLGHLSAVFCLLFDKTGRFIFTGADDLLVKMWGTFNGRLYFTFRGASAEISDLAVSEDNRLLAAGSTDKIIRVWCLITAAPVAVLSKHTGTITALHFCPCEVSGVPSYLAATSGDGTVSFWRYQYKDKANKRKTIFDPEPTRYHEKMRPGGAQMICASFSPGGMFLATGSADHHVRVYMMDGKEGPGKVLEQEAHTERVDSINWGNSPVLRFVSGSKDGTARLWSFRNGYWNSNVLKMTAVDGRNVLFNKDKNVEEPLRVTMTTWSSDDSRVITAVSDSSLCIWDPNTCSLIQRLVGHKDEVYVLEPHPTQPDLLMSGAHDGYLIIWDIVSNKILFRHHNMIDGQGHGAVYDAKWSPGEQLVVAATDSHGHLLFFGVNSEEAQGMCYNICPEEMFFHTDYRPLLRDSQHHVVDEQTQCAPHLLPPPFLVDVEGNPYPADIQRQVPGREHLSDKEALVPGNQDTADTGTRGPLSPNRPSSSQARRSIDHQPDFVPASNIDALIAELAANPGAAPSSQSAPLSEHSYAVAGRGGGGGQSTSAVVTEQAEVTVSGQVQSAPANRELMNSVWRRRQLARPDLFKSVINDQMRRKELGVSERRLYKIEGAKKRQTSGSQGQHEGLPGVLLGQKQKGGRGSRRSRGARAGGGSRSAPVPAPAQPVAAVHDSPDDDEDQDVSFHESSVTDSSLSEEDLEGESGTSSSSTEYSDWGDNNLTPPQRTARKSGKVTAPNSSHPASSEDESKKSGPSRYFRRKKYNFDPTHLEQIPPEYLPSPWLAEYIPKKTPYFPQMGDEVVYFKQGHLGYINLVKHRQCYKLNMKEEQWLKRDALQQVELVKVVGMKYDIRPPRLCCLKLAVMNREDNELKGQTFSIKYHDMNDVVDFLVLRHNYESAISFTWAVGDRYRCQIEDTWWYGSVIGVSPFDSSVPDSPFLSILGLWDSGEEERLSPWDLDKVDLADSAIKDQSPVSREEIEKNLYQPTLEEWRGLNNAAESKRISRALEQVMSLAPAESFNFPVDLTEFPDYMLEIEYPMDFNLIKSRLDNQFYRRSTAAQFDVRYIATNTECYNRPKTEIVKFARILTDLVLRIIQDPSLDQDQVNREYHRLVDIFNWNDTQERNEHSKKKVDERKTSAGSTPGKSNKDSPNPKQWKHDCNDLLNQLTENPDSVPFREPVDEYDFPDYHRIVTSPMDFTLIRESLRVGEYESPLDLQKDMMLTFSNSFSYNTDKKSEVFRMTKRLKEVFFDLFHSVVTNWRKVNRRIGFLKKKGKSPKTTPKSTPAKKTPSKLRKRKDEQYETDDDSDYDHVVKQTKRNTGKRKILTDSDSEDIEQPKKKGKGKGKGKSTKGLIVKSTQPNVKDKPKFEDSDSDEDIPISQRRPKCLKKLPKKKYLNLNGIKSRKKSCNLLRQHIEDEEEDVLDDESEEIEQTPEETEEDDDQQFLSSPETRKKEKRTRIRSYSDNEESTSKARPKRSAQASLANSRYDDESEEFEKEDKIPYKRSIKDQNKQNMVSEPLPGPSVDHTSPSRRASRVEEWSVRPKRQATEKALAMLQGESSSEEDWRSRKKSVKGEGSNKMSSHRPQRQASEKGRIKMSPQIDSEEEELDRRRGLSTSVSSKKKRKPIPPPSSASESEERNIEPPVAATAAPRPQPRRSGGGQETVSSSTASTSAGVIISAADSSTDLATQLLGLVSGPSRSVHNPVTLSEQGRNESIGVPSRRPQRKIVKPIRLQDCSDDEDLKEAKRKNRVPVDESRKTEKLKQKKHRRLSSGSPNELNEKRALKEKKRSRRKSSNNRNQEDPPHHTDFMLSPKAKRQKKNVNYRDETDSTSEPTFPIDDSGPSPKKEKKLSLGSSESRFKSKEKIKYQEEVTGSDSDDEDVRMKRGPVKSSASRKDQEQDGSGGRESRRKEPVRYEEYSYESGDIDDDEEQVITKKVQKEESDESESESGLTIKYEESLSDPVNADDTLHDPDEPESDEVPDDSDENLGRRRGNRRKQEESRPATSSVDRPQRSAGQTARINFREASTDDDLPPKRHHRPKADPGGSRGRPSLHNPGSSQLRTGGVSAAAHPPSSSSEEESSDDGDGRSSGVGVSSRGRVRKPNPRLMD